MLESPTLEQEVRTPPPVAVPFQRVQTRQQLNRVLDERTLDIVLERNNGVPLHTAEQARTAAITMVTHLYGIKSVYAGFNARREGNAWVVPLVYAPPTPGPVKSSAKLEAEFEAAPVVGEVRVSALNAELMRWSGREEVREAVTKLVPPGVKIKPAPPGLSIPVNHHEVAWRYVMWSFQRHNFPPELVAGKAVLDEDEEVWLMPVSMCGDDGEKIWQGTVKVDMHSGHVFELPSPGELYMALNQ